MVTLQQIMMKVRDFSISDLLIIKYSQLQNDMFIDGCFYDSDDMDDDDEICFICEHKELNNGMELLIVWKSDKKEWSKINNIKQDCPNQSNAYINDKGITLESSKGREFQ